MLPELRPLQPHDATWLEALHAECFDEKRRWSAQLFTSFLQNPAAYGRACVLQAEPAGFILGQGAGEEAEIVTLATRPAFRRRGLAAQLVEDFCAHNQKQGKTEIFLEVAMPNKAAIALYRKLGFEKHGIRPDYYQDKQGDIDAWIMRKALEG